MTVLNTIPGTAKLIDFEAHLNERRQNDAIEQAEIAAGWFFNLVTERQKAEFDATMETLRGTVGPRWTRERARAHAKFAAATKEAAKLFDESVEWFLAHPGELLSDELDNRWTELQQREAVAHAMAAE